MKEKKWLQKLACVLTIGASLLTGLMFSLLPTPIVSNASETFAAKTFSSVGSDGVSLYAIKISSSTPLEIGPSSAYFPVGYTVTQNAYGALTSSQKNMFVVNNGDTVFLAEGEFLLLAFGRKGLVGAESVFNSTNNVGGACNITHFVDGTASSVNQRFEELSLDGNNTLYQYGHIFDKTHVSFQEGLHEFVFDYGTISASGDVQLGRRREFAFYLFEKETYNKNNDTVNNTKPVVITPNTYFSSDSVQGFVSKDSNYYTENFFAYTNKTMNVNMLNYPKFVFDPTKMQISIEKVYNKQSATISINSVLGDNGVYSTLGTNSKLVKVSRIMDYGVPKTQIEFTDIGEYIISYQYLYYNASNTKQILPVSSSAFLKEKVTVFGYQLYFSKDYTDRAEFRKITTLSEQVVEVPEAVSISADVTYAISQTYLFGGGDNSGFIDAINNYNKEKVVSTNQSPLKFDFAGTMDLNKSVIWKMDSWADFSTTTPTLYDGSNLLAPGKYVVELFYYYSKYKDSGTREYDIETKHNQLFMFEITNTMPIVTIESLKTEENGALVIDGLGNYVREKVLQDGEFTNKPVRIIYPSVGYFDSLIRVVVDNNTPVLIQPSSTSTITYSTPIQVANGAYKKTTVVVEFGKSFSSNTVKSFTIDKVGISNIKSAALNSQRIKIGYLDADSYVLNQSFSLEWDEKLSGSKTWATYKFIPMNSDGDYLFNSPILEGSDKTAITNGRYLQYQTAGSGTGNILAQTPYTNTISTSYAVTANSVLSTEGLYLFRIYDQAGNDAYYYMVLDKSAPVFLQKEKVSDSLETFIYVTPKALNVVSNTTIVEWGTHKAIALGLFSSAEWRSYSSGQTTGIDPWVFKFHESIYSKGLITTADLQREDEAIITVDFLSVPITGVRLFVNKNTETEVLDISDSSYRADVLGDDGEENEADYSFFIIDKANISANASAQSAFRSAIKNDLAKISSASFALRTTTDMALSTVFISNGTANSLIQKEGGVSDSSTYLEKSTFYKASNALQLRFSFAEDIGNNIAAKVRFYFYPLVFSLADKTQYYSNSGVELFENSHYKKVVINGTIVYILQIPINASTNTGETLQGKYVIERTYETTDETQMPESQVNAYITSKKDYAKRVFTAYIDHNAIMTTPDAYVIGESVVQVKQVGDFWKLTATDSTFYSDDSEENGKVVFKDFFRQDNTNNPIVKTNKNPVEILVPYSMYGTKTIGSFVSGMTHTYLHDGLFQPEISEFFLSISLQKLHQSGGDLVVQELAKGRIGFNKTTGALVVYITGEASAFLTLSATGFWSVLIPSGDNYIGTYRIIVSNDLASSQLSSAFELENENFEFVVQVVSPTPSVSFSASIPYPTGDEIASIQSQTISGQSVGYTNGKSITASWVDPIDDFIIKIHTTKVSYSINGGTRIYVIPSTSGVNGLNHSVVAKKYDFAGSEIPFAHGDEIIMYFGVVGREESDYVYVKKIIIDTTAPTTNLQKLIQADRLVVPGTQTKEQLLRISGERYNRSQGTGTYKYYAFALDIESSFQFEMGSIGNTSRLYYLSFPTKYTGSLQERSLPADPSQTSQSNRFLPLNYSYIENTNSVKTIFGSVPATGTYYEIVEVDIAGNLTIYSIYLYSSLLSTNTLNSSSLMNSSINITSTNAENRIIRARDLLQINELNLSNDEWYSFELMEKTYFTSPFVKAQRANSFMTVDTFGAVTYRTLAEISALLIPSKTNYSLLVRSRQLGVVEIKISLIESTRYFTTQIVESVVNNTNRLTLTVLKNHPINDPNGQLGLTRIKITVNNGITTVVQTVNFTLTGSWQIIIEDAQTNVMYAFELYDNFRGPSVAQSSVRHIYGAAALINPPFQMADGSTDYVYNVETKTITTSKAIDFLFVEAYLKDGKKIKINEDNQGPLDAIVPETSNPIKRITLFPSNEVNGGLKTYFITVKYHGDISATVYTVYVFNKHAEAFLRDDAGNDKADLFRGSVTTDPVVGTFVSGTVALTGNAANLFETKIFSRFNNGAYELLQNGTRFVAIGTYQYLFQVLVGGKVLLEKSEYFTISKEGISTFAVRVQRGTIYQTLIPSGSYLYNGQYVPEYVSNASVFRVDLNSNLFLQTTSLLSPSPGLTKGTYVIRISNKNSTQKPSIYFETIIAITLIVETQNILTNPQNTGGATSFSYYTSTISSSPVITSDSGSYRLISTTDANESGITVIWPKWFGTENNLVLLTLKQNGQTILMGDNSGSVTLKASAQYVFSFSDIAGNTHYFTFRQSGAFVTSNEYTIHYLASVVFLLRETTQVEGYSGYQNAVFNNPVAISIPESTIGIYYDISARPQIFVERNGTSVSITKVNNEWIITEPGLYKVYFKAKAKPTSSGASSNWLPEVPLYFTIVNPNESRWAFEFLEYDNYVVSQLDKNGTSILSSFKTNPNDANEKVRGFVLSYFDTTKTGKGRYTITIQSSAVTQFTFSLWINDGEIPVVVSVPEGTVTSKSVSVQFNMQNIYNNIGDCFVKISYMNPIFINSETLAASTSEIKDISLTEKGVYFIQVFTAGGSLMYSYRIEVKEPLNTISIILIVVGSLTLGSLTFIFVKIRKKIQVK